MSNVTIPSSNNLPGTNYYIKPYIDDASSLPSVNGRVSCILDNVYIEGYVSATSAGPPRTITLGTTYAFQATCALQTSLPGFPPQWTYTLLSSGPTYPWQWFNYSTAVTGSSNFWINRQGQ